MRPFDQPQYNQGTAGMETLESHIAIVANGVTRLLLFDPFAKWKYEAGGKESYKTCNKVVDVLTYAFIPNHEQILLAPTPFLIGIPASFFTLKRQFR
jgi:hypothetical protein